ncbi:MAG: putative rane protein, partial [Herbinix sp.]|nr:putative rane protein [Herbinix sp.]
FILGLVLGVTPNNAMAYLLSLDFPSVMEGQVWRLITWIIPINSMNGILLLAISVYVYYIIGNALENAWGAFRFNLYFFTGILFNIVSSLLTYMITGMSVSPDLSFICGTMFFAFAATYPNMQFRLYFLIPIKAKYLAWFQGAIYIYTVFTYIVRGDFLLVIPLVVSFANFFIFFFATRNYQKISPSEYKRKANYRRQMDEGKKGSNVTDFRGKNVITRHKCAVCGRTELDNDQLEFRFCSKCDGSYEYCMDHLFTHEHVNK